MVKDRIHYMDAMRGCLMMLGVVLHSAKVFDPSKTWAIHSNRSIDFAETLVQIIHMFRMPTFFIVSGYFCLLSIEKYGEKIFLEVRLKRIAIPLITVAVTLNSLQMLLLYETGWKQFNLFTYLFSGGWVSHLWFLVNLLTYFLGVYLVAIFFRYVIKYRKKSLFNNVKSYSKKKVLVLLFVMPFTHIFILTCGKFGLPIYAKFFGFFDIYEILFYLPFFLFGFFIKYDRNVLDEFSGMSPLLCLGVIFISLYFINYIDSFNSLLSLIVKNYLKLLPVWFSTSLCFFVFTKFANFSSAKFRNLSESSYTIYLFHHILVIGFGIMIIKLNVNEYFGFIMLMVMTTLTSMYIHTKIIAKNHIFSFLFNGK